MFAGRRLLGVLVCQAQGPGREQVGESPPQRQRQVHSELVVVIVAVVIFLKSHLPSSLKMISEPLLGGTIFGGKYNIVQLI